MVGFRGKRLAALRQALARAELGLPEGMQPPQLRNLLQRLGIRARRSGRCPAGSALRHGAGVVRSLTRSVRGGPIHNARLVAWDGERVTCPCRPRQEAADGGRPLTPAADLGGGSLAPALAVACARGRRRGSCGPPGSTTPPRPTPWRAAVPMWVNRRWRRPWPWTGSRCGRSEATSLRSAVPPAGRAWCAPALSRAGVRHPLSWRGRARQEAGTRQVAGGERPGGWAVWRWPSGVPARAGTRSRGAHRARAADCCPTGEAVRACGRREGVGVPRPQLPSASAYAMSGRIRTRSVQPRALRSAQGRAGVYRQALSPEHSR